MLIRFIGPTLAALAVLSAAVLAARTYAPFGLRVSVGMALGAASIAAMGIALILSARPTWIESLFGGLDRMYRVHKWLGVAALVLMVGHDAIEPDLGKVVHETWLGKFAQDVGELAFNGFIALALLSWFKRIPFTRLELPWPIWKFTHRFTGVLFAAAAFHQLLVDKPDSLDPLLGSYLNILSLAGLAAWLFTQLIAHRWRGHTFVLETIKTPGAVTEIVLRAEGRALKWQAGQFAFVSAPEAGMNEPHPFTIASASNDDGRITFCIKGLGRWTRLLPAKLEVGQRLRVEGPYGRFLFRKRARRQVWVAGGIGITPFLAWAEALRADDTQEIALFWAVSSRADAFAADRLLAVSASHPSFKLHIMVSDTAGRLTAQALSRLTPFHVKSSELFFCGPAGLLDTLVSGLNELEQGPRRIHHEAFELR
jgi:predicted ferric reductase